MASDDLTVEIYYDGAWHDITADDDVYNAPVTIKRGQSDEATQLRPASISMQLDNTDDTYRTSNPLSPIYGKAGRNTPVRVKSGDVVRGVVEASAWSCDQNRDFRRAPKRGKAWTDLEGGGLLQRIGQWTEPLRSPFYIYNAALTTLSGYWPMEDARGTTSAASPVEGAENPLLLGVSFDSQRRPPGSAPLADVTLQDESEFRFVGGDITSTGGWQLSMLAYMTPLDGSFFTPISIYLRDGSTVFFSIDDGVIGFNTNLLASDPGGATRFSTTTAWPTGFQWSGQWIAFVVKATYSGGTTTVNAYFRTLDEGSWHNVSGTYSGVTSTIEAAGASGMPDGSSFGHLVGTIGTSEDLTDEDRFTALLGHAGETAADRFARLCDLKGIDYTIIGTEADSKPMGPQGVETFPNQLKEIISTEDALIFDSIDAIELTLMLRNARYNQTPALNLTTADLPVPPAEVTDDLNVYNIVTAAQRDGGDITVEDSTSPLGSHPPPAGAGEYRQTVDVNLADPDTELFQAANWWLRRGTVNLPRYPQVTVNLGALDTVTADAVEAVDVGQVITITGLREYVIRLIVLGYTETFRPADQGKTRRSITFTCAPDQQFDVGTYDGTARYDLATCTLNGNHSATATSLLFSITSSLEYWSTTAPPYVLSIAGEDVTVTAMSAVSGSGPYAQTATVTRSTNGISKALPSGSEVHIATPGRYAL